MNARDDPFFHEDALPCDIYNIHVGDSDLARVRVEEEHG
jgi:hypothetical protein